MRISGIERETAAYGETLPLAFVYDGTSYYFDVDAFDDNRTTVAVDSEGKRTEGIEANRMLVAAINKYGQERADVWIARWFADIVAYALEGEDREEG